MKRRILFLVFAAFLCAAKVEASYRSWRNQFKAAQEAESSGEFARARALLEAAEAEANKQGPESFAENSLLLASVLTDLNEQEAAIKAVDAALKKIGDPSKAKSALLKGLLYLCRAGTLHEMGEYNESLANAEQGRLHLESAVGALFPEMSIVGYIKGENYLAKNDLINAERSFRNGLARAETRVSRIAGRRGFYTEHTSNYSSHGILANATGLGYLFAIQKREKEAEEILNKALKIAQDDFSKRPDVTIIPIAGRATLFYVMKRRTEFEKTAQQIYELSRDRRGIRRRNVMPLWLKFRWEVEDGNKDAATVTAERIMNVFETQGYGSKMMAADAMKTFRFVTPMERKRVVEAEEVLRKAALAKFSNTPEIIGPLAAQFGADAESNKEIGLARYHYDLALKSHESATDPGLYIATAEKIAELSLAQKKADEALIYYKKVTAKLREKYGEDSRVAFALGQEAVVLKQLGRPDAARESQAKADAIHAKMLLKK